MIQFYDPIFRFIFLIHFFDSFFTGKCVLLSFLFVKVPLRFLFKEFWKFSERFFGKSIIRMQKPSL